MVKVSASLFIEEKMKVLEGIHRELNSWVQSLQFSAKHKDDPELAAIAKEILEARGEIGSALTRFRRYLPKIKEYGY